MNLSAKLFSKLFHKERSTESVEQFPIKVQLVSSSTLTLDQWRRDTRLVASAKELARHEVFRMMAAVLENSHVRFVALPTVGASQDDRAAQQARSEGYQICLNNLEAMSKDWKTGQMPPETFRPVQPQPK